LRCRVAASQKAGIARRGNDGGGKPRRNQRDVLPRTARRPRRGTSQPRVPRGFIARRAGAPFRDALHVTSEAEWWRKGAERDEGASGFPSRVSPRPRAREGADTGFPVSARDERTIRPFAFSVFKSARSGTSERLMDGDVRADGIPASVEINQRLCPREVGARLAADWI